MRIGTILFRKGGSILKSLSYALSMASQPPPTIIEEQTKVESNKWRVLTEAGHIINDLLHEEVKRQSETVNKQIPPFLTLILTYRMLILC